MSQIDPITYLGFIRNADDSVARIPNFFPATAASADPSNPVLTKDIPINQETGTWARLYLPRPPSAAAPPTKLPVIIYFHGGGLILCSAASTIFHNFLSGIALELPALVVSVDYRLAPEHRLPAAYDDCAEALRWLKSAAAAGDEWLSRHADLSNCYLMGTSAGGNIVYHAAAATAETAAEEASATAAVKIRGVILHHPFFGGVERTASEIRLVDDAGLPPRMTDLMWDLALPVGADRDHRYCNPMKEGINVEKMKGELEGWKILITGCDGDPLVDRQRELAGMMREMGLNVIQEFSEGGSHGIEIFDDSKARYFYGVLKNFLLN